MVHSFIIISLGYWSFWRTTCSRSFKFIDTLEGILLTRGEIAKVYCTGQIQLNHIDSIGRSAFLRPIHRALAQTTPLERDAWPGLKCCIRAHATYRGLVV